MEVLYSWIVENFSQLFLELGESATSTSSYLPEVLDLLIQLRINSIEDVHRYAILGPSAYRSNLSPHWFESCPLTIQTLHLIFCFLRLSPGNSYETFLHFRGEHFPLIQQRFTMPTPPAYQKVSPVIDAQPTPAPLGKAGSYHTVPP